ncbi:hypothetical protein QZH41_002198 [Actinostola sp. cb2023]|nr:hypothetical protein QZH41_002198 [Actinostola sp. cb2023]
MRWFILGVTLCVRNCYRSDAYRIYRNVKQCKDKRDQLKKIYDFWYAADKDMDRAKTKATNYLNELTNQAWKYVKGNLSDPNLLKTLVNVNKIFLAVSPTTPRIVRATKYIRDYVAYIKSTLNTNPDNAYTLEVNLIYGLMTAKFLTECFNERVKFVVAISNECKQGRNALANLYYRGKPYFVVKGGNCLDVGVKEITLGDMQKAIAARATKEKYNADCILNSKDKQNLACK